MNFGNRALRGFFSFSRLAVHIDLTRSMYGVNNRKVI